MPKPRRAPFVALTTVIGRRWPEIDDPAELVEAGLVVVNGTPCSNPNALVRADASIRVTRPTPLRGTLKLAYALETLAVRVDGLVALDLGAAAGGFTRALLDAGARRVYAVDAGVGQLRGSLRVDARVVNLERTNLSRLDPRLVPEPVDIVTLDLSYLAITDAIPQLDQGILGRPSHLIALVKPTFELHSRHLAARPEQIPRAAEAAAHALQRSGWRLIGETRSALPGSRGAVEHFLHAVLV